MQDGSLLWQVVRNLRHRSGTSDISSFHSRQTSLASIESTVLPPPPASDALRLMVRGHTRVRSNDKGVLGYIRDTGNNRAQQSNRFPPLEEVSREPSPVQIFEADDLVVSNLIEDLTCKFKLGLRCQHSRYLFHNAANMDSGRFELVRSRSIQRLMRGKEEREAKAVGQAIGSNRTVKALNLSKKATVAL